MPRRIEMEELLAHADWLRRLAASLVRDPAAADDLVQDTWMAALRRPPGAEPRTWLARVARNLAHNARRGAGRRTTHEQLAHEERPSAPPPELLAEAEAQRLLAEAVTHLPDELRAVVVLRWFRALDSAAIGRELGLSPSAVRTRLQRALEALRRELDRRFGGDRRAWSALVAPYAGLPASAGALVGIALVAAGLLTLAAGWWSLRELGTDDGAAPSAGTLASRSDLAAPGDRPSVDEAVARESASQRSVVLAAPAALPAPERLADIEGQVLVDGLEPGRPITLEVVLHFGVAQGGASGPASGPAQPLEARRGRAEPREQRSLATDETGRFQMFAAGAERRFELRAPGFLVEPDTETRGETPARGLVVALRTPPMIRGRIVTGDREPVHGTVGAWWLQAEHEGWQMFSGPGDLDCDAEGRFAVSLLTLLGEGTPESCSAQLLLEVPRVGRRHVDTGVVPLADHDLGTLVLEPVRVLRFRVRDGRGQPLAGAVARLDDLWLSKPSSPTNGEGFGELRHAPDRAVPVRFSAFGCVDQVLLLAPGDEPEVWLAADTVLEVQLERPAGLDGPFPMLVLSARAELLRNDAPEAPIPGLLEAGWIQGELGATPVHSRDWRKDAGGRTSRAHFVPDAGGKTRIVGLTPDVLLLVEALDAAGAVLARGELVLAPGEHRRLALRHGE